MREVLGFHGTSLPIARQILKKGEFRLSSPRNDHWLGQGAYFFYEDYEQAYMWATLKYRRLSVSAAVIEASIAAERKKFLNLDSRKGLKELIDFITYLREKEKILLEQLEEIEDARVVNFILSSISPKDKWVIMKTFSIDSNFNKNPNIKMLSFEHNGNTINYTLTSTQICVKNHEAIRNLSISRENGEYNNYTLTVKRESVSDDLFD